jgi:NitT/TauT family transport system substrate-binding protein
MSKAADHMVHPGCPRPKTRRRASRRGLLMAISAITAGALLTSACGGSSAEAGSAGHVTKITVGTTNSMSDGTLYIAEAKGYFKDENIKVEFMPFKSGGEMISALGTGGLDVGGGGPNAGLYNALNRDIKLRIVADKGHIMKEASYFSLVVRKELVDSGKVKSVADLKGLKIADYQESGTTGVALAKILETEGLKITDVKRTFLGGTAMMAAFQNGSVDAGILAEPYITLAQKEGIGTEIFPSADVYPNQQGTVLMYSEGFAKDKKTATAFMRAYLKAARTFTDAVKDGRLAGTGSEQLAEIIAAKTKNKPAEIREMAAQGVDPNGRVNVESLETDLTFWKANGWVDNKDAKASSAVDESFADAAAKDLGAYTPGS